MSKNYIFLVTAVTLGTIKVETFTYSLY